MDYITTPTRTNEEKVLWRNKREPWVTVLESGDEQFITVGNIRLTVCEADILIAYLKVAISQYHYYGGKTLTETTLRLDERGENNANV